ncbi:MAG: ribosome maturation factor RimM [Succinivibrionaceae bacterium]
MTEREVPEVMGRFGAVFGIKGWLKVFSYTEDPKNIFSYKPWFMKRQGQDWQSVEFEAFKPHTDCFIAKIKGIDVREEAQALTGADIGVLPSSLPKLPQGSFRWIELMGMKVVTVDGYDLGMVKELMETGANQVLVVKANIDDKYEIKERLIPYIEHVIVNVDPSSRVIQVSWDPDF